MNPVPTRLINIVIKSKGEAIQINLMTIGSLNIFYSFSVCQQVKYAPKVKVAISSGMNKGKIRENSELRVRCDVDANPKAQKYLWYINSNPVVGDYTDEMVSS